MVDSPEEFIDRPRGILTRQQREHLLGLLDEDLDEDADAIRQRNYRIRRHIRHSLIDFVVLSQVTDPAITQVFDDFDRDTGSESPHDQDSELAEGIDALFEFLYYHLGTADASESAFHWFLDQGVRDALGRLNAEEGASVYPKYVYTVTGLEHKVPLEKVKEDYEAGEFVFHEEIDQLYLADVLSYSEMKDAHEELRDRVAKMDDDEFIQAQRDRIDQRSEASVDLDASVESRFAASPESLRPSVNFDFDAEQ